MLELSSWFTNNSSRILTVVAIVFVALLVIQVLKQLFWRFLNHSAADMDQTAYRFMFRLVQIAIWLIAILLILSNLGYNVDSLLAGLGIGGIAIALAMQAVLGDLISSVSIIADKPFKVRDFVVIGKYMGTVEKIGVRSTRIRSINGEEIIAPNSELANTMIQNFGRMRRRRALHKLTLAYSTPQKQLKEVPAIVISLLGEYKMVEDKTFRIHLVEYGDCSIDFELQFYVTTADYNEFLTVQQEVLLAVKQKFDEENIEFAFPTYAMEMQK